MAASAEYSSLPFDEAIRYFRDKVDLPTQAWTDLWEGMHTRAFTVAGAVQDGLLCDLRRAVDKAISEGTTLESFRKDFDALVERHGWAHKGGRAWRSKVIYEANVSTAYSAGHYKRMTDPAVRAAMPYWRYVRSSSEHPRPEHLAWVNVILRWDDPWWDEHYPPNGWGCKCGVVAMTPRQVDRLQAEEAGGAFPVRREAPAAAHRNWVNPASGEEIRVPRGVDPGWGYNPGRAAWGKPLSREVMDSWRAQGGSAWERLTGGNWESAGRPERLPARDPRAHLGPRLTSQAEMHDALRAILGGEERAYSWGGGSVLANAETLSRHMPPARSQYLPLLPELLEDPEEVWLAFERHRGTGMVVLRQRLIRVVRVEPDRTLLAVAQARKGLMEAWTMIPLTKDKAYLQAQRSGMLLHSK